MGLACARRGLRPGRQARRRAARRGAITTAVFRCPCELRARRQGFFVACSRPLCGRADILERLARAFSILRFGGFRLSCREHPCRGSGRDLVSGNDHSFIGGRGFGCWQWRIFSAADRRRLWRACGTAEVADGWFRARACWFMSAPRPSVGRGRAPEMAATSSRWPWRWSCGRR